MENQQNFQNLIKIGNLVLKLAAGGVLVLSSLLLAVYVGQNKILYIPKAAGLPRRSSQNPYGYRNPSEQGLQYEDVEIITSDKTKIRGWFMKQNVDYTKKPTVIFFHENAGNLGTRLYYFSDYMKFVNVNMLAVAYRGYSESDGYPSEKGIQDDVIQVMKYLFNRTDIDKTLVFTHGRSLGGATSLYAVTESNYNIKGCIIENSFTSIDSMSKVYFPQTLTKFNKFILKNKWDSLSQIIKLKSPGLFIRTVNDEIVPSEQMKILFDNALNCPMKMELEMTQGGHNDNWIKDHKLYFTKINEFLSTVINGPNLQKL